MRTEFDPVSCKAKRGSGTGWGASETDGEKKLSGVAGNEIGDCRQDRDRDTDRASLFRLFLTVPAGLLSLPPKPKGE